MADAAHDVLVYVTYAREDLAQVEPIVAILRQRGINLYFDATAAHGAGNYVHESQQALGDARALIVFVSSASAKSPWVESETQAFQAQIAGDPRRFVLPVCLDDTAPPASLARYNAIHSKGVAPSMVATSLLMRIRFPYASDNEDDGASATESQYIEMPAQYGGVTLHEPWPAASFPPPLPDSSPTPAPKPAPAPAPAPYFPPPQPVAGPVSGAPGYFPSQPGRAPSASVAPVEQVTFTAYHPREMQAHQWQPLVFYLSLDTPAVLAEVAAAAADRLAGRLDKFRAARSQRSAGLARGAKLRLIPVAPGLQFNPSQLDVTWQEDVQQHEFRMRAESATPGQSVNGVVQVYQGMVLRGEVPISIFVGQAAAHLDSPDAYARAMARAYRRIFASYSHRDTAVVESCETAARTMGDQFLRDVSLLQAGVEWDPRLIQAINDADVFQLFWSKRAAQSQFVAREWQHALKLLPSRPNFIRPVYWSSPLYPTPPELNSLHFQQLSLSTLGWGPIRSALYALRNR